MIRHEHRTLPFLIALGVLLGAGLAMASPAGHGSPSSAGRSSPTEASVSPSPARESPAPSTTPDDSDGGASSTRCDPAAPVPGWATSHEPLAHAIRVLAHPCGDAAGLTTAIGHLVANQHRHDAHSHGPTTSHGSGHGQPSGHGHPSGQPASGHHHQGGGNGGTSGGSGGSGVDVIHGNGHDGDHGKDTNGGSAGNGSGGNGSGGNGSADGSSTDTGNGSAPGTDHGPSGERGGSHRPALPATASVHAPSHV
jgi:hypothetical protein